MKFGVRNLYKNKRRNNLGSICRAFGVFSFIALYFSAASDAAVAAITSQAYVDRIVAAKANLATSGTAGAVATVDAGGQYTRSAVQLSDLATKTDVQDIDISGKEDKSNKVTGLLELAESTDDQYPSAKLTYDIINLFSEEFNRKEDKMLKVDLLDTNSSDYYPSTLAVNTALSKKADLAAPGTANMVAAVDAAGQYIRSGLSVTGVATKNDLADKADKSTTYTKTEVDAIVSAITPPDISGKADVSYVNTELAKKANTADLATVATSGSYNDLSDRPTITTYQTLDQQTINSGTETIAKTITAKLVADNTNSIPTAQPTGAAPAGRAWVWVD